MYESDIYDRFMEDEYGDDDARYYVLNKLRKKGVAVEATPIDVVKQHEGSTQVYMNQVEMASAYHILAVLDGTEKNVRKANIFLKGGVFSNKSVPNLYEIDILYDTRKGNALILTQFIELGNKNGRLDIYSLMLMDCIVSLNILPIDADKDSKKRKPIIPIGISKTWTPTDNYNGYIDCACPLSWEEAKEIKWVSVDAKPVYCFSDEADVDADDIRRCMYSAIIRIENEFTGMENDIRELVGKTYGISVLYDGWKLRVLASAVLSTRKAGATVISMEKVLPYAKVYITDEHFDKTNFAKHPPVITPSRY